MYICIYSIDKLAYTIVHYNIRMQLCILVQLPTLRFYVFQNRKMFCISRSLFCFSHFVSQDKFHHSPKHKNSILSEQNGISTKFKEKNPRIGPKCIKLRPWQLVFLSAKNYLTKKLHCVSYSKERGTARQQGNDTPT